MRTFIALDLPELFKDETVALSRQLAESVQGRFMKRDTYHITLAFLGDQDDRGIADATDALDATCADTGPVLLKPRGLGKFGRAQDATLWLGLAEDPQLMQLANRLRKGLDTLGVTYDEKPFRPHITLARRAKIPKIGLPVLPFPQDAQATAVTLYKSELDRDGAAYSVIYRVEL